GGVLSPLLSNIMLHEFDCWLDAKYLNKKATKDRWAWNFGIQQGRPITVREKREWKPAVAYCRYADDFVVIVKGTKAHAEAVREERRAFLEGKLKLTLNMEKTHITHVNDGFVFLGHRIIRKRGSRGRMTVVTTIPKEKAKAFAHRLSEALSGDHDLAKVDMVDRLNRQLRGWAAFYKYTDFTATTFQHIDHVVFWKMAHWLARKYRSRIKPLMRNWYRVPADGQAKTWLVYEVSERGRRVGKALHRLVSSPKAQFRWRNPEANPYIFRDDQKDHHLTISGCRNGHGPGLNGEPYALKGARTVRGGEALMRFLLHSPWRTALSISSPWSIGSAAGFSAIGYRSPWRPSSASRRCRRLWRNMASRKSSTRIRAANSPAPSSPVCCSRTASPSAWTAKAHGVTTSLSSGFGGRSNMRKGIS